MVAVRIVSKEMVRPAWPAPEPSLYLSAADIMVSAIPYNRRILFYKIGDADEYPIVLQRLRESLSVALAHFYPLAGRLQQSQDQMGGRLYLDCNDAGAELVEACVEGVSFEELQISDFEDTQPFFLQLAPPRIKPSDYAVTPPLLIVQVSRFECGSIALGIAHSHVVCDGTSLWHFMTSWAECARGEKLSVPPVHTRTLLKIENPSPERALIRGRTAKDDSDKPAVDKTELKLFHFSKEMVSRLRAKAGEERTSYEALCAHIWKHSIAARGCPREREVCFAHVVNMRKKLKPPLPDGYFGNVLMWVDGVATVGELEDEDLEKVARRLHDTIALCDDTAFKGWLHWLELYGREKIYARYMYLDERTQIRVSSSPRFPVFEVDFGWGAPAAVRLPSIEQCGKVTYFPGADGFGSIDAMLQYPAHILQCLTSNHAFTNP